MVQVLFLLKIKSILSQHFILGNVGMFNKIHMQYHGRTDTLATKPWIKHPYDPDGKLIQGYDPIHVGKGGRNMPLNSREKTAGNQRLLMYEKPICWDHLVQCYEEDKVQWFRSFMDLSERSIYLTHWDKMSVNLAMKVSFF